MQVPELVWPKGVSNEDLLVSVTAGRVVLLVRGRNAWHNTWVRHFFTDATIHTDLESAKHAAERLRERGNVFYLVETPALQLRGTHSNVVLCDTHPANPFGSYTGLATKPKESRQGRWIGGMYLGVPMQDVVESFRFNSGYWKMPRPSPSSLRSGSLPLEVDLHVGRSPFQSLVSVAQGAGYYLGWRDNPSVKKYVRTGTNAIARRWQEQVSEAGIAVSPSSAPAKALLAYREKVINASPESAWRVAVAAANRKEEAALQREYEQRVHLVESLSEQLRLAALEVRVSAEERFTAAATSAGIRAQRERAVAAVIRERTLAVELQAAQRALAEFERQHYSLEW